MQDMLFESRVKCRHPTHIHHHTMLEMIYTALRGVPLSLEWLHEGKGKKNYLYLLQLSAGPTRRK